MNVAEHFNKIYPKKQEHKDYYKFPFYLALWGLVIVFFSLSIESGSIYKEQLQYASHNYSVLSADYYGLFNKHTALYNDYGKLYDRVMKQRKVLKRLINKVNRRNHDSNRTLGSGSRT